MTKLNGTLIQSLLKAEISKQDNFQNSDGTINVDNIKDLINLDSSEGDIKDITHGDPTNDITTTDIPTNLLSKNELSLVCTSLRILERKLNNFKIKSHIQKIFIVAKIYDDDPIIKGRKLVEYILETFPSIEVYIQEDLTKCNIFKHDDLIKQSVSYAERIKYWNSNDQKAIDDTRFDLIVTLGGDGTVLFASWLFQKSIPPMLSFNLGSLGFLTKFEYSDHQRILSEIVEDGYKCSIRMRFECTIMKSKHESKEYNVIDEINKGSSKHKKNLVKEIQETNCANFICEFKTHTKTTTATVFNELVIDRGPNSVMASLELFGDNTHLTTAEADGMIISTTNGSTAYSLSAGGSLIHPEIPGILLTPVCPHTLSFRPLVIPESIIIRIGVPYDSRTSAWCSFDGRDKFELKRGDFITVTTSRFPLTFINNEDEENHKFHWFKRLNDTLHWNDRKRQTPFNYSI